jgi:hypothetical protein
MNPVGLTSGEQEQETDAPQTVKQPAPAGSVSCRIVVLPQGNACGAAATGRIVWADKTKTPACADCARLMDAKAKSMTGTGIVGFEPLHKEWAVGTKNNPSRYSCFDKAEADEPMFTLLARDPMAPGLIRLWSAQKWQEHGNPEKIAEARGIADAMEAWRKEHR